MAKGKIDVKAGLRNLNRDADDVTAAPVPAKPPAVRRTAAPVKATAGEGTSPARSRKSAEPPLEPVDSAAEKSAKEVLTERGLVRTGYYLRDDVLDRAKSAYLIDFDTVANAPGNFALWVGDVIARHSALSPARRKKLAAGLTELEPLPKPAKGEKRLAGTRSFVFPASIPVQMDAAIVDDRVEEHRVQSRSEFLTEALRLASDASAARNGGTLPPPPKRLPNDPARG